MDVFDIGLTKLAVASGVLFIASLWDEFMAWVEMTNPWYFLAVFVLAAIRPSYRFFVKK